MLPLAASAAGTRTKDEAYGDETYAQRFLSLYDDVVTKGQENGYLSKTNTASGGFGVPYHAVETCNVLHRMDGCNERQHCKELRQ